MSIQTDRLQNVDFPEVINVVERISNIIHDELAFLLPAEEQTSKTILDSFDDVKALRWINYLIKKKRRCSDE